MQQPITTRERTRTISCRKKPSFGLTLGLQLRTWSYAQRSVSQAPARQLLHWTPMLAHEPAVGLNAALFTGHQQIGALGVEVCQTLPLAIPSLATYVGVPDCIR